MAKTNIKHNNPHFYMSCGGASIYTDKNGEQHSSIDTLTKFFHRVFHKKA